MKHKNRWIEPLKTLLLLLLLSSALVLGWKTRLFQSILVNADTNAQEQTPLLPTQSYQTAAQPTVAVVTGPSGLRHGIAYADDKIAALMKDFGVVLGETLGSAQTPTLVSDEEWREALSAPGLYLDYGCSLSLSVLIRWLGSYAALGVDYQARRLLLSPEGETGVALYYVNEQGNCYRCATLALQTKLLSKMSAYLPNGAEFAFQIDSLKNSDPYILIQDATPPLSVVKASDSGWDSAVSRAAELFRVKLSAGNSYPEQDGTVYLGENGRLRLESGGYIRYTADEGSLPVAESEADRIEWLRHTLEQLQAAVGGDGVLQYAGTFPAADGVGLIIRFSYRVGSIQVLQDERSAAWGVFVGGSLQELAFHPRVYSLTAEPVYLPPPLQAAAAAGSIRRGGTVELVLPDADGEQLLYPIWNLRKGSREA